MYICVGIHNSPFRVQILYIVLCIIYIYIYTYIHVYIFCEASLDPCMKAGTPRDPKKQTIERDSFITPPPKKKKKKHNLPGTNHGPSSCQILQSWCANLAWFGADQKGQTEQNGYPWVPTRIGASFALVFSFFITSNTSVELRIPSRKPGPVRLQY